LTAVVFPLPGCPVTRSHSGGGTTVVVVLVVVLVVRLVLGVIVSVLVKPTTIILSSFQTDNTDLHEDGESTTCGKF
jgi:hypothetical protein